MTPGSGGWYVDQAISSSYRTASVRWTLQMLQAFHKLTYLIETSQHQYLSWSARILLQWRHNEYDGVSNHQPLDCLLNRLFGCRSKNTSHAQMTSNAENVSIWWRHHIICVLTMDRSNDNQFLPNNQSFQLQHSQRNNMAVLVTISPVCLRDPRLRSKSNESCVHHTKVTSS